MPKSSKHVSIRVKSGGAPDCCAEGTTISVQELVRVSIRVKSGGAPDSPSRSSLSSWCFGDENDEVGYPAVTHEYKQRTGSTKSCASGGMNWQIGISKKIAGICGPARCVWAGSLLTSARAWLPAMPGAGPGEEAGVKPRPGHETPRCAPRRIPFEPGRNSRCSSAVSTRARARTSGSGAARLTHFRGASSASRCQATFTWTNSGETSQPRRSRASRESRGTRRDIARLLKLKPIAPDDHWMLVTGPENDDALGLAPSFSAPPASPVSFARRCLGRAFRDV